MAATGTIRAVKDGRDEEALRRAAKLGSDGDAWGEKGVFIG